MGWGNHGWSANIDYLEKISRLAMVTPGYILECGSGLSSLLLGLLAEKGRIRMWSLEHDSDWFDRNRETLERYGVQAVKLCLAPLREYEGFSWYAPSQGSLPAKFSLVICDGPPGTTPGGRYGLLPVMKQQLTDECVVLLDDAHREEERQILERWRKEYGTKHLFAGPEGRYAVVTFSS